jgi:hypothetical protein
MGLHSTNPLYNFVLPVKQEQEQEQQQQQPQPKSVTHSFWTWPGVETHVDVCDWAKKGGCRHEHSWTTQPTAGVPL